MAVIHRATRTLFFVTSPRSPMKMVPEIDLLTTVYGGKRWSSNPELQAGFMKKLVQQDYFQGGSLPADPAFAARDRITRGPKALGFVDLEPVIKLTPAGNELVYGANPAETLLRQLVKFQLPSPYHRLAQGADQDFWVKPYLEILRLVHHFGSLAFDELKLFGLQLTNYRKFDDVVLKIERFRADKAKSSMPYRKFYAEAEKRELASVYAADIEAGEVSVREGGERTVATFVKKKRQNLRDYADACFRYLQATEVVSLSQRGHSLSVAEGKEDEVEYLLHTIPRDLVFVDDEERYKAYLFDATEPTLLSDDRDALVGRILALNPQADVDRKSVAALKAIEAALRERKRKAVVEAQVALIKDRKLYEDIQSVFDVIGQRGFYDAPLVFEWNMWRAMTMLDGGDVRANFKFDDNGEPLSSAPGNMPDIFCDYGDFDLLVEVTLQTGQKQYDNEGEPVARHLGRAKERAGKETFCLFVAPKINPATVAFFYMLHKTNVAHYGGKAVIVPMELQLYRKMLADSRMASYVPDPARVRALFEASRQIAETARDERDWHNQLREYATTWLAHG